MLNNIGGISYGFSTRANGDMRVLKNRLEFLQSLGLDSSHLITPKQIHSTRVVTVNDKTIDRTEEADGFVSLRDSGKKNIALGVIVADCVPLIFADKKGRGIGVAHAGWKGTKGNIASKVVLEFEKRDIPAKDILVYLGPHIGKCCYNVPEERAKSFLLSAEKREGKWYIDLGQENVLQLMGSGIPEENIELSSVCTSDNNNEYFSYRKDSKETYGEIMALIGYR